MNPYLIALLIGLASGAFPAWWITADHYQGVIAKEHEAMQRNVIEQQEKNRLALLAYADRIVKAGVEHDKNAKIVADLRAERERVRVVFPDCSAPGTTEGSASSNGSAWVLSKGVDAAFADLQIATGRLIERCDLLNIEAMRWNTAIR